MTTPPDTGASRLSEGQRIEWKASWRDDHLKSLCAFANADGGTLEIGRDDDGKVVGVAARERRRLLEELPNKLRDLLGIVAPMDVREDGGVPYLRIVVEPYPVAISYRGVYYQRSGSTNQMLRGPALDRFLLGSPSRRCGRRSSMQSFTGTTRFPPRSRFACTMTACASTIQAHSPWVGRWRSCSARTRPSPTTRTSRTLSSGQARSNPGDAGSTAFFALAGGPGHRNRRSDWSPVASGLNSGFRTSTWRAWA